MAHASYAHQVRPVTRLTPRRRASDWPLMPRLSLMAPSGDRSIRGRIYDRTEAVTPSSDHSLDTGRSPYTELARVPGTLWGREAPPASDECDDGYVGVGQLVHQPKSPNKQFSGRRLGLLRHQSAAFGEVGQALGGSEGV